MNALYGLIVVCWVVCVCPMYTNRTRYGQKSNETDFQWSGELGRNGVFDTHI